MRVVLANAVVNRRTHRSPCECLGDHPSDAKDGVEEQGGLLGLGDPPEIANGAAGIGIAHVGDR